MSDIINILPDSVANQIAAGEVVDRPASAVKELLENAMDAGASHIQLIIKDAGRTLIQVIDNGCGMSDSDARLCFERHATSKIKQADDLFSIHTMGFRGEALASIAAIAQIELKTRLHDSELGTLVEIEGSSIKDQHPTSCPAGTSIAVKNLFFNVPARRNFLKKDAIELSHIEEVFRRIALIHCDIGFSFHHNGKLLYDLRPDGMLQRICQIYGSSYKERFYPVSEESDVVIVNGYISKAEYARRSRSEQYLFVNGRFIKHPMLSAAIEKAYTDMIPEGLHPGFFVSLTVDPSRIDVNIHPTKTEVRFVDESALFAMLRAVAKKALGQFSLASEIEFNPSSEFDFSPLPQNYIPQPPQIDYSPNYNPFSETRTAHPQHSSERSQWESFFDRPSSSDADHTSNLDSQPLPTTTTTVESLNIDTSACFQIQNRYIGCPTADGLLIVDQQLAHERILFERLTKHDRAIGGQQLLFPVNCSFSAADADILNELSPELQHSGFAIERLSGSNVFVLTAMPDGLNDSEAQDFFDSLISEYKGIMMEKFAEREKRFYMSVAHRMAAKAIRQLKPEEMKQVLTDLMACSMPGISPKGERTTLLLSASKINDLIHN